MPAAIRRLLGVTDDPQAGGTNFDVLAGGNIPDSTIFWPVTGGTVEPGLGRIDRANEVRGRRAVSPPLPFRSEPAMTVPAPAYRSIVEKVFKKVLGSTDTVTGTGLTGYTHTLTSLPFGSTQLPTMHVQVVRDDLNHKMSGSVVNRTALAFPLDGEGTIEVDLQGLYYQNYTSAIPTPTYTDVNDVLMLRDATAYLDGSGTPLAVPAAPTLTPSASGGTLAAATTYNYRIAARSSTGSTLAGPEAASNATTTGATSSIAVSWTAVPGATSYDVYGRTAGAELLLTNVAGTTYTDTGAATPAGALPTSDFSGGTKVPDLIHFDFSFTNNIIRKFYAGRCIRTQTLGAVPLTRKLWFPAEYKLGAAQDITYGMTFGNTNTAQDVARDFAQIQKIVFTVVGGPTPGATSAVDTLQITIFNALHHTAGGPDALAPRGDITYRVEGGGFYSAADATDISVSVLNSIATPLT